MAGLVNEQLAAEVAALRADVERWRERAAATGQELEESEASTSEEIERLRAENERLRLIAKWAQRAWDEWPADRRPSATDLTLFAALAQQGRPEQVAPN